MPRGLLEIRARAARLPPAVVVDPALRRPRLHGTQGSEPIDGFSLACIGTGAVGWSSAESFARMGVGSLLLVDPGRTKPASLLTHPIRPEDVGRRKVLVLGRLLKRIAPRTRVFVYVGRFEDLPLAALLGVDTVLLATDRLGVEVETGLRCARLGIPLVQASVHGETLVAHVRTFANRDPEGPCPACAYGPAEWQAVSAETTFSCDGVEPGRAGSERAAPGQTNGPVTASFSALCSLAAQLAVLHVVRRTLGIPTLDDDSILEFRGFGDGTTRSRLERNPDCPGEHGSWQRLGLLRPVSACTFEGLLAAAGAGQEQTPADEPLLEVGEHVWVDELICACGTPSVAGRFLRVGQDGGTCPRCGGRLAVLLARSRRCVPARLLAAHAGRPGSALGVTDAPYAVVQRGERGWLLLPPPGATSSPPIVEIAA